MLRIGTVLLCMVVVGLTFTFGPYYGHYRYRLTTAYLMNDTMAAMKLRFLVGLGVGAGVGLLGILKGNGRKPGGSDTP